MAYLNWKIIFKQEKNMKNLLIILLMGTFTTVVKSDVGNLVNLFNAITDVEIWDFDVSGFSDDTDPIDRYGEAVAHGDFNNDGWDDLAIGIPNYDFFFATVLNTGAVQIIYGSPSGLTPVDSQLLFQSLETDPPNFENNEGLEANDFFGQTLASGDFNCDGISDLAVGTPEEDVTFNGSGGLRNAVGAINIFYGSNSGFADLGAGSTFIHQGSPANISFEGGLSAGDRFGWSMAVGNFNGDSDNGNTCDDLAVSAPFEDFGNMDQISDGGQVEVYYGHTDGLSADDRDSLSQQSDDIPGSASEDNDQFGLSLAAGMFRSGILPGPVWDLAVGIPGQDVDGQNGAGAVQVFNGGLSGLDATDTSFIWSQSGAINGVVEANDNFGSALTTGRFNGDLSMDLAVSAEREDLDADGINDAGAVHIIYGSDTGLTTNGNQIFTQNSTGIDDGAVAENSDRFGDTLTSADLNYDFIDDLVVGVPRENDSSGAFHIILGSANGITTVGHDYVTNFLGDDLDEMTYSMTVGNFGNGPELVVGMPGNDSVDDENDSGAVKVYEFENPDVIFKDDFEG